MRTDPDLAKAVKRWIDTANQSKSELLDRWKQVDQMYYKGIKGTLNEPWEGAPDYPYPVAKTRMDQVTAYVAGGLTRNTPYINVSSTGPAGKDGPMVASVLHYFLRNADYPRIVREAVNLAQRRGVAVIRPSYFVGYQKEGSLPVRSKIKLDVIDPADVVVYPNWATKWDDMKMIGHRYEMSLEKIKVRQKLGRYADVDVKAAYDSSQELRPSLYSTEDASEDEQVSVELYDLYINTLEGVVRAVFCPSAEAFLSYEPYEIGEPPLIRCFLHSENNRWYNETSRGYDLVAVQQYEQDLRNLVMWAGVQNSFPPVFGQNTSLTKTAERVKPGAFLTYTGSGQLWSPPAKTDASPFVGLLQLSAKDADTVSRVSHMGMGVTLPGTQTATEINALQMGQMAGVSEDSANMAMGLAELAEHVCKILYWHFHDWSEQYADVFPDVRQEQFGKPYVFEVNGESQLNTPMAVAAQITQILQTLPNMIQQEMQLSQLSIQYAQAPESGIAPYVPFMLKAPDFLPELLRALVSTTQIPAKDAILPPREVNQVEGQAGGAVPVPGMELLAGFIGQNGPSGSGAFDQPGTPGGPDGLYSVAGPPEDASVYGGR